MFGSPPPFPSMTSRIDPSLRYVLPSSLQRQIAAPPPRAPRPDELRPLQQPSAHRTRAPRSLSVLLHFFIPDPRAAFQGFMAQTCLACRQTAPRHASGAQISTSCPAPARCTGALHGAACTKYVHRQHHAEFFRDRLTCTSPFPLESPARASVTVQPEASGRGVVVVVNGPRRHGGQGRR